MFSYVESVLVLGPCFGLFSSQPGRVKTRLGLVWFFFVNVSLV
jgi:hypothetical protein